MSERPTRTCDECTSVFYADASPMAALCPECAHLLYDYPACAHTFTGGRCLKCNWDGSASRYIQSLDDKRLQPNRDA